MKRGTTPTLQVRIGGVNHSDISTIKFRLQSDRAEGGTPAIVKDYPGSSVTYDAQNDLYNVALTEADTYDFRKPSGDITAWDYVYMDTKVTTTTGQILGTEIVKLKYRDTLFPEVQ